VPSASHLACQAHTGRDMSFLFLRRKSTLACAKYTFCSEGGVSTETGGETHHMTGGQANTKTSANKRAPASWPALSGSSQDIMFIASTVFASLFLKKKSLWYPGWQAMASGRVNSPMFQKSTIFRGFATFRKRAADAQKRPAQQTKRPENKFFSPRHVLTIKLGTPVASA